MATLSPDAKQRLDEAHHRRVLNEVNAIAALAKASRGRVALGALARGGGGVLGFSLFFNVRTSVAPALWQPPRETDLPMRERMEVRFQLDLYPSGPPAIGLLSDRPLFLPAVLGMDGLVEGRHPALVCTHRGRFSHRVHDLPFFVTQVFRALSCDPAVLNAPHDALNPQAALWFLERRDRLALPFEPDLDRSHPGGAGPGGTEPPRAFKIERVP